MLVHRQGELQRVGAAQAAVHVSRHEAEAWCRWAGRRLPTEPEWELAAFAATRRGFAWGDVLEWVAGSALAFPGADERVAPGALDVIGAILHGEPPPLPREIPGALARILARCLAKDRDSRYPTARALADDARTFADALATLYGGRAGSRGAAFVPLATSGPSRS